MPIISLSLKNSPASLTKTKVVVNVGDKVVKGQILIQIDEEEVIQVMLAKELGVKNKDAQKYLLKKKGEKVRLGDVLAAKKGMMSTKVLKSPVGGIVTHFNEDLGTLSITVATGSKEVKSMVKGEVVSKSSEEIEIKFSGEEYPGENGHGEKQGILRLLKDQDGVVDIFALEQNFFQAIVLGNKWTKEALAKAQAMECGVIGVDFPPGAEIASGNSLNDFGILSVNLEIFNKLKGLLNKEVYLAGSLTKLIFQP